ncbi:nuclear transport factor 2 family protein [Burkholderia sp. WAC0059]|uniref:nuclear transport factor 2 family protein n=1 Tax=Burkholderia sp. WAC0059 TaxID=2066022 RepID=UPI000C7EE495|nr:nuclear transport factor 2 family protein [Burkholderia sp. WAC0059]PLZ00721.1 nuclear transport factor 2 family protein [Burkholderia sp. WAC0059]
MSSSSETEKRIALVKEYFRKGDTGDTTIINMFADDVELYFPKFGTRSGKAAVGAFVQGLLGQVQSLQHYQEEYTYIPFGDYVVVEGWESGVAKDGTPWPVKGRSDGRFCNVFRFRDDLISHLHIYVDPDFAGRDTERFYWGLEPVSS